MNLRDAKLGDHPKYWMPDPEPEEKTDYQEILDWADWDDLEKINKSDETLRLESELIDMAYRSYTDPEALKRQSEFLRSSIRKDMERTK